MVEMSTRNGKRIHSTCDEGGEHFIPTVGKVDAFCEQTNTVYEFQGCFWHGCPKCYTADRINPVLQRDMIELQQTTATKNIKIRV